MLDSLRRLFGRGRPKPRFTDEEFNRHYELKRQGLEKVLGPMAEVVGHAMIPFMVGGTVDMYYFPNALPGTGFATTVISPSAPAGMACSWSSRCFAARWSTPYRTARA